MTSAQRYNAKMNRIFEQARANGAFNMQREQGMCEYFNCKAEVVGTISKEDRTINVCEYHARQGN
jgi:hypothetical protein